MVRTFFEDNKIKGYQRIVAKALDGQQYLLPLGEFMQVFSGEMGSGLVEANDLCLIGYEALHFFCFIRDFFIRDMSLRFAKSLRTN